MIGKIPEVIDFIAKLSVLGGGRHVYPFTKVHSAEWACWQSTKLSWSDKNFRRFSLENFIKLQYKKSWSFSQYHITNHKVSRKISNSYLLYQNNRQTKLQMGKNLKHRMIPKFSWISYICIEFEWAWVCGKMGHAPWTEKMMAMILFKVIWEKSVRGLPCNPQLRVYPYYKASDVFLMCYCKKKSHHNCHMHGCLVEVERNFGGGGRRWGCLLMGKNRSKMRFLFTQPTTPSNAPSTAWNQSLPDDGDQKA